MSQANPDKLPCRGCTTACGRWPDCDKKPWRTEPQCDGQQRIQSDPEPKKHVVIYGGTGFVGSHIAHRFVEAGYRVSSVSPSGDKPLHLKRSKAEWANQVNWLQGDVGHPDRELLARADTVVTTVGSPPVPTFTRAGFEKQYYLNGTANIRLLEAVALQGVQNLLIVSAQIPAFLQFEGFAYAKGKQAVAGHAINLFKNSKTNVTVLKPSVVYGLRHTKTGRAINLGFLSFVRAVLQRVGSKSASSWRFKLQQFAPVSVESIASKSVHYSGSSDDRSGVKIVGNESLLSD